MSLNAYALTSVQSARDYLGNPPTRTGFWIYSPSPTGATAATVEVADNLLTLTIVGGASAGTNTFTLSAAAYDTVAELVAAINALTGKWVAGALCNGAAASADLCVAGSRSALGAANELTLMIEDNYGLEQSINRATDYIERWAGRRFLSRSYNREQYVGNGRQTMILREYPATRVFRISEGVTNAFSVTSTGAVGFASVEVLGTTIKLNTDGTVVSLTLSTYATIAALVAAINGQSGWSATLIAGGTRKTTYIGADGSTAVSEIVPAPAASCKSPNVAYIQMPDTEVDDAQLVGGGVDETINSGMLTRVGGWIKGVVYFVDYTGGLTSTPAALEEACLRLVKMSRDEAARDGALSSESLGDYSYTIGDAGRAWPAALLQQMALFRAYEF